MLCGCVFQYAPGALSSLNRICRVPFDPPDADPWTDKAGVVVFVCHCQQILAKHLTFCFQFSKREDLLLFWLKWLHYYCFGAELLHWYLCVIYCSKFTVFSIGWNTGHGEKVPPLPVLSPGPLFWQKKKMGLLSMARDHKNFDFCLIISSVQYDMIIYKIILQVEVTVCGKTA